MKIKRENQLGLNFTQKIKDEFYSIQSKNVFDKLPETYVKPFREQWKEILSDNGNTNLLFSSGAKEIAEKIKVDKFKASILKFDKPKKLTFLIDSNSFFRVCLSDNEIFALHVKKQLIPIVGDYISYDAFKIKPYEDLVVYPKNQEDYLNDSVFVNFLRLLIFTEYSDTKEVAIKPNQSYGNKKQGKYMNESSHDVVLVDSNWNNVVIRTEGFGVSGHFRLQAIGKNREMRKLIYISEFYKQGYIRGSKKETVFK